MDVSGEQPQLRLLGIQEVGDAKGAKLGQCWPAHMVLRNFLANMAEGLMYLWCLQEPPRHFRGRICTDHLLDKSLFRHNPYTWAFCQLLQ